MVMSGGTWKAMEEGKVRSIGVCSMSPKTSRKNIPSFETKRSVNQIQFNPFNPQKPVRQLMAENHVHLEAWNPLGEGNKDLLTHPVITKIAKNMVRTRIRSS
jgi:diketogulonate reductase-like aldo/keto reductase